MIWIATWLLMIALGVVEHATGYNVGIGFWHSLIVTLALVFVGQASEAATEGRSKAKAR